MKGFFSFVLIISYLRDFGIDIEVIAKILGHSSTRETRLTYAKMLDRTVVSAMTDYEKRLKG